MISQLGPLYWFRHLIVERTIQDGNIAGSGQFQAIGRTRVHAIDQRKVHAALALSINAQYKMNEKEIHMATDQTTSRFRQSGDRAHQPREITKTPESNFLSLINIMYTSWQIYHELLPL